MPNLTPSAVRNKLENRIRKLSGRKSLDERIEASKEAIEILNEYLAHMEAQRKKRQ